VRTTMVEDLVDHLVDHHPDLLLVYRRYRWSKMADLGVGSDLGVGLGNSGLGRSNDRCCSCFDQGLAVGFAGHVDSLRAVAAGFHAEQVYVVGSLRLV